MISILQAVTEGSHLMAQAQLDGKRPDASSAPHILDRQPPFDLSAEHGVLGSLLLKPDTCDDVALILRENDFYDDANRTLFRHMMQLHDAGATIDAVILVDHLKSAGVFEAIGGTAYLARIGRAVPNAAHAKYYAKIVLEKSTFRSLINVSTEILRDAYDQTADARGLLSDSEQKIFSIVDDRGAKNVNSLNDILHRAMDRLEQRMSGQTAHLRLEIDGGETVERLVCDGIIASTALGSTAYHFSASGHACHPSVRASMHANTSGPWRVKACGVPARSAGARTRTERRDRRARELWRGSKRGQPVGNFPLHIELYITYPPQSECLGGACGRRRHARPLHGHE